MLFKIALISLEFRRGVVLKWHGELAIRSRNVTQFYNKTYNTLDRAANSKQTAAATPIGVPSWWIDSKKLIAIFVQRAASKMPSIPVNSVGALQQRIRNEKRQEGVSYVQVFDTSLDWFKGEHDDVDPNFGKRNGKAGVYFNQECETVRFYLGVCIEKRPVKKCAKLAILRSQRLYRYVGGREGGQRTIQVQIIDSPIEFQDLHLVPLVFIHSSSAPCNTLTAL